MKKGSIPRKICFCRHFCNRLLLAAVLWVAIIILCSPMSALSDTEKAKEKKNDPELQSLMSNDELLKQAQAIFNDASGRFLAYMRAVSKGEILLEQARQKTESSEIPGKKSAIPTEGKSPAEIAGIDSDHARLRADALKNRYELLLAQKTLYEKQIRRIETARSAAREFYGAIEGLNLFLLEISLRVDDGTLSHEEIPDSLNEHKLLAKKQELTAIKDDLKQKADAFAKHHEAAVSRAEEAKKGVIEAEAAYTSAKTRYAQELKQQELEKEHSGHTPERLLAQISELQEERAWLRAAFSQSHTRFVSRRSDALIIQKDIEVLPLPEKAAVQIEDVQQAIGSVEKLVNYHTERIRMFGVLRSSLRSFVKQGHSFEGDATVLNEHMSKMQMIANILDRMAKEGKIKPDSIPGKVRAEVLRTSGKNVSDIMSESLAVNRF
ncbi:MAG: hypothetical protein GY749_13900 [Desulfobacteraceae bacterium]|nr:hypothetical protein [Desulfobacteraceae bacterium]